MGSLLKEDPLPHTHNLQEPEEDGGRAEEGGTAVQVVVKHVLGGSRLGQSEHRGGGGGAGGGWSCEGVKM